MEKHHRNYNHNNISEIKTNVKEKSLTKNNLYNFLRNKSNNNKNSDVNNDINDNNEFIDFLFEHNFKLLPVIKNYSVSKSGTVKKITSNGSKIFDDNNSDNKINEKKKCV